MLLSRNVHKEDEHSTTWMNSLSAGMLAKRVCLEMHIFKAYLMSSLSASDVLSEIIAFSRKTQMKKFFDFLF